ncbi:Zinc finger CCCH domain-containing protein 6 [Hypsizygus marmoreus]|uniref:Zinc finger CCCH domain-containing protein 6 n=1 Tax=Hypsizygus marmoreus TaxID=39966 RepID=A0A369J1G8_HYPMA|nr:Zinc finger CCCH domain-containing protein 6 [Hypsizygus marmoreus]
MSLTLPLSTSYDSGSLSDPGSASGSYISSASMPKFPHTRAQLSAIARQHKPLDHYDSDFDGDEFNRVSSSFVNKVVALLVDENEDELKTLLKSTYDMDDDTLEQNVLDLMHKHRDDVAGVPFLFLTPTRRPISRPSSRASTNSTRLYPARPDTPASAPASPLAQLFRRPHTPVTSPLAGSAQPTSYMSAKSDYSPSSSPILAHAQATHAHAQFTASLPASPLSSPRMLNAKASEFKPIPRPLSAASSVPGSYLRNETPSPDLWAHNSPRATSNLAIAAPLIADQSPSQHPRSLTPSSSLRTSLRIDDDEDEDDPFDPFSTASARPSFHSVTVSDYDSVSWPYHAMPSYNFTDEPQDTPEMATDAMLTDGMTPFDVLTSVFGSTLAPSELEDALAANGYDFDRAMAWLVDRAPQPTAVQQQAPQIRMQPMGGRVTLVSRDGGLRGGPPGRGGGGAFQNGGGPPPQRYAPTNNNNGAGRARPVPGGNRVCRYFMAGECLRADCRFSHDLERALCRFWLRGTCAKQENCEFLHHLPKDVDMTSLNVALTRANVQPGTGPLANVNNPPPDDFPALGFENGMNPNIPNNRGRRGGGYAERAYNDPGRTRFAAAVKKPAVPIPPSTTTSTDPTNLARREAIMGPSAASDNLYHRSAIVAPRPSPRLKLHPPQLLPTLPTGDSLNSMYMAYRSRALQLGAARNACLSRAADAWRRGDGAAAKRFSREGHELNAKMGVEMAGAAAGLVRERAKVAEQAVRGRDAAWSDDPGDRGARGVACGGGFGVCLGVAGDAGVGGGGGKVSTSAEERTECVLDLHGLHANEATEVLEQFLLALENEHYYGLAYAIVGEEKHTGTQDVARGASRARLATGVREWLHRWGYPWSERDGIICIDPLTHASE